MYIGASPLACKCDRRPTRPLDEPLALADFATPTGRQIDNKEAANDASENFLVDVDSRGEVQADKAVSHFLFFLFHEEWGRMF